MPGFPVPHHFPELPKFMSKFMSIESVMPSNHLIFCRPLLLLLSAFSGSIFCQSWDVHFTVAFSLGARHAAPTLLCLLILPAMPHPSHMPTSHLLITNTCVNFVTGQEGESCLRTFDCRPGLCCARHFWTKICKPVLLEGQVCSRRDRKDPAQAPEIFQRCDCGPGLTCRSQGARNRQHARLRLCQKV